MVNEGIFSLLKTFSMNEIKRFEEFIESPYHNKSKKIISLFKEIRKYYPQFDHSDLEKSNIAKKINPALDYNDSTFRSLMSDLSTLLKNFLTIERMLNVEWERNVFLLRSLIEKSDTYFFDKCISTADSELEVKKIDSTYFYNKGVLELLKYNYNCTVRGQLNKGDVERDVLCIIQYIVNTIKFFVMEITTCCMYIDFYENKYSIKTYKDISERIIDSINLKELSDAMKNFSKNDFVMETYIDLYYAFSEMNEPAHYKRYKDSVLRNMERFSRDEANYHFTKLISYCHIKNCTKDFNSQLDKELFDIYNIFLKGNYFLDDKTTVFDDSLFRNILYLSLKLKKFEWALDFIETYSHYLHPDRAENLVNFSYAEYYFYTGSDSSSVEILNLSFDYLNKISEEAFIVKYDIKIIYLMLYYDLGSNEEFILTQMENFKKFLKRNSLVTPNKKESINKFINLYEKLLFLKNGDKRIDTDSLYLEILKNENIKHHVWLKNKVDKFVTSRKPKSISA